MAARATIAPAPGGVEVSFAKGVDRYSTFPDSLRQAGLVQRFAVVQHTYVEGCVGMYFDEPLWRTLAAFVADKGGPGQVEVLREGRDAEPILLEDFLQAWDRTAADAQEPPPMMTARSGGRPVLGMVTDYWTRLGGPKLYHDSYAYSLFSDRDLGPEVMDSLAKAPARDRWTINPEPEIVSWTPAPSLTRRLTAWLTGPRL